MRQFTKQHVETNKPLESLALIWQEVFDVGTSGENPLQVDPPPLNVNPDIKESVDPVQSVLPGHGIILKHLEVGGQLHGRH